MREYLILSRLEREATWKERGVVTAHSPESAITRAVKDKVEGEVFVAVPTRNWTMKRPQITEREPVITLEDVPGQMTVEDVLDAAEAEGLVASVAPTK